ncbi:MAG TPA: DUF2235 domain-containing protein [Gammaproteobacteria bacterium]|nr:DUF2235 domain-containing protein [Gammaproteobacteria bacterium]
MKNIVICCDGTGNEYSENNTNVIETYTIAKKTDKQLVFYDPGVGTGGWEYMEGKKTGEDSLKSMSDKATGEGLQNNVNDAYEFLMETYEQGDRLFLFGFSRGAFTVRSLAGMLYKVGLLPPDNDNLIPYASKLYNIEGNLDVAHGFRSTFCRRCPVHFIGVWDTVSSLVMNAGKKWHDGALNPEVKYGYHALAIDEQRKDFMPALWLDAPANLAPGQLIEQVWFAGVHANVGGWYDERGLSNIALHWMLNHAKARDLLIDDTELGKRVGNPDDKLYNSRTGLWKIRGKHIRKVPAGVKVHKSVFDRRDKPENKYQPKNLLAKSEYTVIG